MGPQGYPVKDVKTAWVVGVLLLCLTACEPLWSGPDDRAQDFLETLVTAPTDLQKLRDLALLAPERNPEDLLGDLSARVALDFLRAKHAQGVALKFSHDEARGLDATRDSVTIRVAYLAPGTSVSHEVKMHVQLEKNAEGQWRIVRLTGAN